MKLPQALTVDNGLTLIEIIIAAGILVILFAIMLPVGISFYQNYQLDSERNTLVALLEYARNLAVTNQNESAHGVYLDADNFIVFQGSSYASRIVSGDKFFPRTAAVAITAPNGTEAVFFALSGQSTASTTYAFTNGQKTIYVYLNSEGRVEF